MFLGGQGAPQVPRLHRQARLRRVRGTAAATARKYYRPSRPVRLPRGYVSDESRRRCGCDVAIPWYQVTWIFRQERRRYTNGRLWDPSDGLDLSAATCNGRDQQPYVEVYHSGVNFSVMNPAEPLMQDTWSDRISDIATAYNTSGMYVDQISCSHAEARPARGYRAAATPPRRRRDASSRRGRRYVTTRRTARTRLRGRRDRTRSSRSSQTKSDRRES